MQGEREKSDYAKPEKSGVTPGGVKSGARESSALAATHALEQEVARLVDWKAVWGRRLDKAFHAVVQALWAQPMRWFAVGVRLLERIDIEPRADRYKLVSLRVRLELARLRELFLDGKNFCLKRVLLHGDSIIAVDYVNLRSLLLEKFLLDLEHGVVDANAVTNVGKALDEIAKKLERLHGCRCEAYKVRRCHAVSIAD